MTVSRRRILLTEWARSDIELSGDELAELQQIPARVTIQPVAGSRRYAVTPKSVVGSATTRNLQVVIQPKLRLDRVFFLLGYARNLPTMRRSVDLGHRDDIVEAFVRLFLADVRRVLRRGLLMGYVRRDAALPSIRGRIRFDDQLRRRFGLPIPVEVRFDEYTVDIPENRLIKAALRCLSRLRLRDSSLRPRIAELLSSFDSVSDVVYAAAGPPQFTFNRLTERYRQPLGLARLVVENASVDLAVGDAPTSSMLFDMDEVFEDFVFAAVGDELGPRLGPAFRWRQGRSLKLDAAGRLRPKPDLSLWLGSTCVFVGDAKYKRTVQGDIDDLYQILAYCSASGLPEALLVYGESSGTSLHHVVYGGPTLRVASLDVTQPIAQLLGRCAELADLVAAAAYRALAPSSIEPS